MIEYRFKRVFADGGHSFTNKSYDKVLCFTEAFNEAFNIARKEEYVTQVDIYFMDKLIATFYH